MTRDPMFLAWLIRIAGLLHFGVLIASALVPQVLDWRTELKKLTPLSRQIVWVHGAFIVLVIVGFGSLSLLLGDVLAAGDALARAVCAFVCVFWSARLGIQFFSFDASPYLSSPWLKAGYHGLTIVFLYFAIVYGFAAVGNA